MKQKWIFVIVCFLVFCLAGCHRVDETMPTAQESAPATTVKDTLPQATEDTLPQATEETLQETTEPTVDPFDAYLVEQLTIYRHITMCLDAYNPAKGEKNMRIRVFENGDYKSYFNYDAFAYCYQKLVEMEWLDPWLNEEGWAQYSDQMYVTEQSAPNFDRISYLEQFTVLEDVLLRVDYVQYYTEQEKGTYPIDSYGAWYYNRDGSVYYVENGPWRLADYETYRHITSADVLYKYDDAKKLSGAYFGEREDYRMSMTPTYDAEGHLISEFWDGGAMDYRIDYTYEGDRLMQKVLHERVGDDLADEYYWVTTYLYDEQGNLQIEEERGIYFDAAANVHNVWRIDTKTYTYDRNGILQSMEQNTSVWHPNVMGEVPDSVGKTQYSYQHDDRGRLISRTTYLFPTQFADGTEQLLDVSHTVETYVYGDAYIFAEYEFIS